MMRPAAIALAASALGLAPIVTLAAPAGGEVVGGSASIRTNGVQTDIVQSSARAVIDWRRFDIGAGEAVHFRQPDARSVTLNRVTGADPSQILGTLTANGQVILLNPNGVLFGREARVDTAGLVVSTARLATADFMAGRLGFTPADRPGGSVVNQGSITVREGGVAAFVAPHVRNEGSIRADLGRVMLASGSSFTLDLAGDGLLSLALRDADVNGLVDVNGRAVTTLVDNTGSLVARSGNVVIVTPAFASRVIDNAINLGGIVRADAVERGPAGTIVLKAANGQVQLPGEIATPGGTFAMRRDDGQLTSIAGETAAALGRVLRTGTHVSVAAQGRLDIASAIDGRGGASGAGLNITAASIGVRSDLLTHDGTLVLKATAGTAEMLPPGTEIAPGRSWPLIMTGGGDIRLEATGSVLAAHLITRANVHVESFGGNVNIVTSLGKDLNGSAPLGSLTVRALGKPDSGVVGNVSELHDVAVAPGGRIDIAASRNIQIFATGAARPGLEAARRGTQGRSLQLVSHRLGAGDLTNNAFYWNDINSTARHTGRGTSPVDAAGRWTSLRLTTKEPGNPTAGAPPGPTNVLLAAPVSSGLARLDPAPEGLRIQDVLPATTTVVLGPDGAGVPTDDTAVAALAAEAGYSAGRGVGQLADTGRGRGTATPKDVFELAEHVVELAACPGPSFSLAGPSYFLRGTFGQPLNINCR